MLEERLRLGPSDERAAPAPTGAGAGRSGRQEMFDAQFSWPLAHAHAELALWEGRDQEAFQAIAEGLAAMSRAGDDTGWPVLYAVGLPAAADRAERVSARRATARLRLPGTTAMRC